MAEGPMPWLWIVLTNNGLWCEILNDLAVLLCEVLLLVAVAAPAVLRVVLFEVLTPLFGFEFGPGFEFGFCKSVKTFLPTLFAVRAGFCIL